jgi:membrane dipeptidase
MLDEAMAIHLESPPIDLHADTLLWHRLLGYNLLEAHTPPLPRAWLGGHLDLPRLRHARWGGQFFGIVTSPVLTPHTFHEASAQIDALHDAAEQSGGALRITTRAEELEQAKQQGWVAALLGMEGAHGLGSDPRVHDALARMPRMAARGLRYMGIVHLTANRYGRPAFGIGANAAQGLTQAGFDLIAQCEALGVLVDLSHLNVLGFHDAIQASTRPTIVSHAGVAGVHPSKRNLSDEQIRSVANRGGVIGIMFCPVFLGSNGISAVVDHLQHLIRVGGEGVAALGSDWDGFIVPTRGLHEPNDLVQLTRAMLHHGMSRRVVRNILRDNVLRVLREVPPRTVG